MNMRMSNLMNRMRGRLTCAETLKLLQQYLDGELTAEEARRVAQHLDLCTMCDEESALFRGIKDSIAATAKQTDPEVLARLDAFGQRVRNGEMAD